MLGNLVAEWVADVNNFCVSACWVRLLMWYANFSSHSSQMQSQGPSFRFPLCEQLLFLHWEGECFSLTLFSPSGRSCVCGLLCLEKQESWKSWFWLSALASIASAEWSRMCVVLKSHDTISHTSDLVEFIEPCWNKYCVRMLSWQFLGRREASPL